MCMVFPKHKQNRFDKSYIPISNVNPSCLVNIPNKEQSSLEESNDEFDEKKTLIFKDSKGLPLPVTHQEHKTKRPIIEILTLVALVMFTLFYYRII